jgi:hypothetical protein
MAISNQSNLAFNKLCTARMSGRININLDLLMSQLAPRQPMGNIKFDSAVFDRIHKIFEIEIIGCCVLISNLRFCVNIHIRT